MSVERNLLISLLKCTQKQAALIEYVNKGAQLPTSVCIGLLQNLQNQNLIYLQKETVEVDSESRLKLALKAIIQGADIQVVSNLLCWQEFEEIAAQAGRLHRLQTVATRNFAISPQAYGGVADAAHRGTGGFAA